MHQHQTTATAGINQRMASWFAHEEERIVHSEPITLQNRETYRNPAEVKWVNRLWWVLQKLGWEEVSTVRHGHVVSNTYYPKGKIPFADKPGQIV